MTNPMLELTSDIVSSYLSNNTVQSSTIPELIQSVYVALNKAKDGTVEQPVEPLKPAVPVKKSVTPDYIVCLEDGKKFKSLKRHLRTHYDLSPEQYRERWNLPHDYPMVAPSYATARSELAKKMGLGNQRKKVEVPVVQTKNAKKKAEKQHTVTPVIEAEEIKTEEISIPTEV